MRRLVLAGLTAVISSAAATAVAEPIEPFVGVGLVAPTRSSFRSSAEQAGFDTRSSTRLNFNGELGVLFGLLSGKFNIGPTLRFDVGRLGAPYGGVEPIRTDAVFLGAREELQLFRWPRILLWVDESIGVGSIGQSTAHKTMAAWSVRFGLALRIGNQKPALRVRLGYAIAPTFGSVTDVAGKYDFGGFVFAIDGVLRVGQ